MAIFKVNKADLDGQDEVELPVDLCEYVDCSDEQIVLVPRTGLLLSVGLMLWQQGILFEVDHGPLWSSMA